MAGIIYDTNIQNGISYTTINSPNPEKSGGLIGLSYNSGLKNSLYLGKTPTNNPLIANPLESTSIVSSYYDKNIQEISSFESYGKTTSQLKNENTFVDWNFNEIWEIDEGKSYPNLKWLNEDDSPITKELEIILDLKLEKKIIEIEDGNEDVIKFEYYIVEDYLESIKGKVVGDFKPIGIEYILSSNGFEIASGNLNFDSNFNFIINPVPFMYEENFLTISCNDVGGNVLTREFIFLNSSDKNTDEVIFDGDDDDNDRLANYLEDKYGTNKKVKDTDGDGLTDYEEIYITKTDPLIFDSIQKGLSDSEADNDNDGLINRFEVDYGTDPSYHDTDRDGLSDGDEINIFNTDPKNPDTNGNGVLDGDEVITIKKEDISSDMKLEVEVVGKQSSLTSLEIKNDTDNFYITEDFPGLIGSPYDISFDEEFEKAYIKFEFEKALLNNPNFDPRILYFNEETKEIEEVTNFTQVDNTIIAEVEHFSIYFLVDIFKYWGYKQHLAEQKLPTNSIEPSEVDIIFIMDSSIDMRKLPKQSYRIDAASEIADKLNPEFRIALLERFDNLVWWAMLHHNRNAVINGINSISRIGLANYPSDNSRMDSINEAIEKFDLWSKASKAKHIILFSNGDPISEMSSTIRLAREKNIRISEIAMTDKASAITKSAFESTQGRFLSAFDEESLELAINNIITFLNADLKKDSDNDGLPDDIEKAINDNSLKEKFGRRPSGKLDINNPDTDGDGLEDGNEVKLIYYNDKKYILSYILLSDPCSVDTDKDGIDDAFEVNGVQTDIGLLVTDPTKKDTDEDTLSDGDEIGISSEMVYDYVSKEYYYIVNSNPLLKDSDNDDLLDDVDNEPMKFDPKDSRVGVGFSSKSSNIILTGKGPINATKEGENFKNAQFFSNNSFKEFYNVPEDRSFLIEFNENNKPLNYWLEVARVGSEVRGGNGNTIFAKCKENPSDMDDYMFPSRLNSIQNKLDNLFDIACMDGTSRSNYLERYPNLLQDNFLFYDKIKNEFYPATDEEYGDTYLNKIFRYELNDDYDKYLPQPYYSATIYHGFTKVGDKGSQYHDSDNNFKYTHKDGREGIYSIVSHKPLVLLENEYTRQYGPTFNYIDSNLDLNFISNFFGHFYFDMLTYYWWDAV